MYAVLSDLDLQAHVTQAVLRDLDLQADTGYRRLCPVTLTCMKTQVTWVLPRDTDMQTQVSWALPRVLDLRAVAR